jgi:hypothetical protein
VFGAGHDEEPATYAVVYTMHVMILPLVFDIVLCWVTLNIVG